LVNETINSVIDDCVNLPETASIELPNVNDDDYLLLTTELDNNIRRDPISLLIDDVIERFTNMPLDYEVQLPVVSDEDFILLEAVMNIEASNDSIDTTIHDVIQRYLALPAHQEVNLPILQETELPRNNILMHQFRANEMSAQISPNNQYLDVQSLYLGTLTQTCVSCDALLYETDKQTPEGYSSCCQRGKVKFPEPSECPPFLRYLYTTQDHVGKNFRKNINSYNSAFCMLSFPGSRAIVNTGPGQHVFKIQGHTYHRLYPADAPEREQTKANQVFFLDPLEALNWRKNFTHVNNVLVHELNEELQNVNPHMKLFHTMREILRREEALALIAHRPLLGMRLVVVHDKERARQLHAGRLNDPCSIMETAVVFEGEEPPENIILEIRPRGGGITNINSQNELVIPFTFPLLRPRGELGHDLDMRHEGPNATATRNRVSFCEAFAYELHVRPHFSTLFHAGRLFQKIIVCYYVIMENNNLTFIRQNQAALFSDTLRGLTDYVNNRAERLGKEPGRAVVLPSSFHGSPRFMHKLYLNAMAVVREFGKPDFFITMTTNPKWPEIVENLLPGQVAEDRPELVARVFEKKLRLLKDLIIKYKIFGEVAAFIYNIEYQKRGLQHAHILIILKSGWKI
jgi:hypothetical protein